MHAEEPVNNNGNTGIGPLAVFLPETGVSYCQGPSIANHPADLHPASPTRYR